MKTLVVYYSWSCGNTEKIAKEVAERLNADIEKLETVVPYPKEFEETASQGQDEVESHYCPLLKPLKHSLDDYDCIAMGTPTWWYSMAPAVRTFLSDHDLKGKKVILFMTNAGWPGNVIDDMKQLVKGKVISTKEIQFDSDGGNKQITMQEEVDYWLNSLHA